ncbi:MAG: GNAT family N-acetyltransferase [Chlamydiae bacterium]|nr:GNAT family N-acetyltransferase [Chlamydiota bacterium]
MIHIRPAKKSEIDWVNTCYDEVEFVHSIFENEVIAVAELERQRAGLGRLVRVNDATLELGGIYVFSPFRKKGVAKEIVQFLLHQVKPTQTVYCLPFGHLISLYTSFGFAPCASPQEAPKEITKKLQWCKKKYPCDTLLLQMKK